MTGTIVVGVDGSGPSLRAVSWAATEAGRRGVRLCICCVANDDAGRATLWTSPQLTRRDATDVAQQAEREARRACRNVETSVRVVVGEAVTELTAAAGARLLVVGCRGLGAFSGLLLGSVSERLARHVTGPLVVVRGEPTFWPGPVLVGIDDMPETSAAVEYAVAAADRAGVALIALTAAPPAWPAPPVAVPVEPAAPAGGITRVLWDLQEDVLRPALDRHSAVQVEHRTVLDGAAHALIEASPGCGLLVLGRTRTGRLGSVCGHVLRHASCPVAVIPAVQR